MRAIRTLTLLVVVPLVVALPALSSESTDADGRAVSFYDDVLPILQQSCQNCHRENGANLGGMVAPMAFTSYDETRPWAKSIARKVEAREMPPWHASPDQAGVFENERTLSQEEIEVLVRWARTGARAGDPATAPPERSFPSGDGWQIGEPDLIVEMPVSYLVEDAVEDQYITFESTISEEMLPQPRWVQAVEFRPGSKVVHHIIAPPLGGIAPGNDPTIFREGHGRLLEPGTTIRWQMHYHKEPGPGTGVEDQSRAAIRFYPEGYEPTHVIQNAPMGNMWFEIPPGDPDYSTTVSYTLERDSKIVSFLPHAHLRGKSATYIAHYPDGREETLLEVPEYDFNWQTEYRFKEEKPVPAGTRVELIMAWDNSADNPSNPDPTTTVVYGEPTTAEMMFGFMNFTDAVEGYEPEYTIGFEAFRDAREQNLPPQEMMRRALGTDLDSLRPEDKQRMIKSFMDGGGHPGGRHEHDAGD